MDSIDTFIRLGLSLLLAMPIGWERESAHKVAGLRTHLLVSLGCCLFTLVGVWVAESWKGGIADPGRIAAQVVTGIGFLGGGAILRAGGAVRGLTTAASIWSVAAIGMACGAGYYAGAVAGCVGTFLVLRGVEGWERKFLGVRRQTTLRIRVRGEKGVRRARGILDGLGLRSDAISVETTGAERILVVTGHFPARSVSWAFQELGAESDVLAVERVMR